MGVPWGAKERSGETARFTLARDDQGRPLANDVRDDGLTVHVYAAHGSAAASASDEGSGGSGSGGGGGGASPFRLVVAVEERRPRRWLGGVRRLCHASTTVARPQPPSYARGAATVLGQRGTAVLVLGLRDCRQDPAKPPPVLSKAMLASVVARASLVLPAGSGGGSGSGGSGGGGGGGAILLDATATFVDLPVAPA
jgi:hypothetical protein